ncbi:protein RICE SALT SENSITIVE 3-like [Zingiber officinale]|uniref:protein RICE SALT SENSITIVE 3-like n=1 Tax=Zingiber officinale TaxID=94328 RepID=UPI001C4DA67D|nr:protein RICE SALT SENSITIVE 3-like [Zingiber officinale]XP_042469373.1 protein RICE SALT SENSITIVE 3-like [Zingiber officinale]XP_042469375.1 protein RICE SALT SENSITIVE 3-like [Zingiber officinale]
MFMEEQLNPLAASHLLQHTLRSLCSTKNTQWIYAVFWRILPRNYPPPKWDFEGGVYNKNRGNRRNWILAWEDGFCNFAASSSSSSSSAYEEYCQVKGLQPELFFKMSHEIYNYGEGFIGKVAADESHKYVFKEAKQHELTSISTWNNPSDDDAQPRTWEAQFQSGIKTIALVAVKEGVVQLGSIDKVMEDLSFILLLREKFNYLESIPGVLLPHPSSIAALAAFSVIDKPPPSQWASLPSSSMPSKFYDHYLITPSINNLELLLSSLPVFKSFPMMGAKEEETGNHGNDGSDCHL